MTMAALRLRHATSSTPTPTVTYTLSPHDAPPIYSNGCTATTTGDISQPDALTASSSNTAILCHGGSSTVSVSASGGTQPYSGTQSFTHGAGTYSVTVTDDDGCTAPTTRDILHSHAYRHVHSLPTRRSSDLFQWLHCDYDRRHQSA